MSRYWSKMSIVTKDENNLTSDNNSLFISQERPVFLINRSVYTVKSSSKEKFSEKFLKLLEDLYVKYFTVTGNNRYPNFKSRIEKYLQLNCELLAIRIKRKLVGSMISLLVPVSISLTRGADPHNNFDRSGILLNNSDLYHKIGGDNLIFASASYLAVKNKYRGKGFGMAIIQESLQVLYENGGITAYFVNKVSRSSNSIPVNFWGLALRDKTINRFERSSKEIKLNIQDDHLKSFALKLNIQDDHLKSFALKLNNQIGNAAPNSNMKVTRINTNNVKTAYDYYITQTNNQYIKFSPTLDYFTRWINVFDTYLVKDNEIIIGLFSIKEFELISTTTKEIYRYGNNLLFTCNENKCFQVFISFISECKNKNIDILTLCETGYITADLLNKVGAIRPNNPSYINFYNTNIKLKPSEFHLPLF
jgi:hypothetical protein